MTRMIPADREHALGEVDDDGHHDRYWRRYRYICRCGKAGPWCESVTLARGHHNVHRSDVEERS